MGWSCTYKPKHESATDFMLHSSGVFTWGPDCPATYTVLATSIVNLRTFYAAVERVCKTTGKREVWAAVILLSYHSKSRSENFCWKSMDESEGPVEARCPERILDLLTPTENTYAIEWRARCRKYHADQKAKPKLEVGGSITLYGKEYDVVEKHSKGFYVVAREGRGRYTLSHVKARQCSEVRPPTKPAGAV